MKKVIHQIVRKWTVALFSRFYGFCFNTGKRFSLRGFILKPLKRTYVLLINVIRNFQNSPPFGRSACFYLTITGNDEHFQYFNFQTNFLKKVKLSQTTTVPFFSWKYFYLKRNISTEICPVRSQCLDK